MTTNRKMRLGPLAIGVSSLALSMLSTYAQADAPWTGSYTGNTGVDWHYTLKEDAGRVHVEAFGMFKGERLPITCEDGRLGVDHSFNVSCRHSEKGLAGIPPFTLFTLQGQLVGDAAQISYAAENRGRATFKVRQGAQTPPIAPAPPPVAQAPVAEAPPKVQLSPEQIEFNALPQTAIAAIQEQLKRLGFYVGAPDGLIGRQTTEAVNKWQAARHYQMTGFMTAAERDLLQAQATTPPPATAASAGVWSGTTKSDISGTTYHWRFESKGDHVDVRVSGQRDSETYPIECGQGRFARGQEFAATCRYLKAPPGVAANATFELRADLSGEMTDVTYMAGTFVSHFTLQKEQATAQPPSQTTAPSGSSGAPATPPPPAVAATTESPNKAAPEAARPTPPPSAAPVTVTEANKAILEGDRADIIVLMNTHPEAPHASIDLRGAATFKGQTADTCFLGADRLPVDAEIDLQAALLDKSVASVVPLAASCAASLSQQWDLAVGRRSDFLALPKPQWEALDQGLSEATRKVLLTLPNAELTADREARAAASLTNESKIMGDGINGWGFLLPVSDAAVVCTIAPSGDATFAELVRDKAAALQKDMGRKAAFKIVLMDADTAYQTARKKQCGVVFAKQTDLKVFLTAVRRDKVEYKVASAWIPLEAVESALQTAAEQKASQSQATAEAQRSAEAERELRRQREEADGRRIAAATAELRRQNGPKVSALASELKDGLGTAVQPPDVARQSPGSWYGAFFPQFASWSADRRREGWEPVSHDVEVVEFGQVKWNGRSLELILVRARGTIRNRTIGQYKDFCFLNGYVLDQEFQMRREPLFAACDQAPSPVAEYLRGLEFQSGWNAK